MASQWPIAPGQFFDYEVRPEIGYAGTYFYHSHVGFQAVTAAGALIVESAKPPPYEYDEDRIIALSEFYEKTDEDIEHGLTSSKFSWSGDPATILVNGQGRLTTEDAGSCELASIKVEPGKTYRLRFIGATALTFVSLAIESHDVFKIIEADGHYTKPVETSYVQLASGQRYSVLLKAKTEDELEEAKSRQFYFQITIVDGSAVQTTYAVLEYPSPDGTDLTTVPATPPLPIAELTNGWLDYKLEPYYDDPDFPTAEEVTRRIIVNVHSNASDHNVYLQSGYDWMETFPKSPYLVDVYTGNLDLDASYERAIASGFGYDKENRLFPAKMNEILEIVWQNQGGVNAGDVQSHPFHGHGRHFYDIGGGPGLYDPEENEKFLEGTHPVNRDTTVLYAYGNQTTPLAPSGWRAWRIRVTGAGVWMMHCHILQHMVMGMQTVFTFGNQADIEDQSGPIDSGYLTYGGSAYGSDTHSPIVRHFF
jgi:L-ascorbate oxidase